MLKCCRRKAIILDRKILAEREGVELSHAVVAAWPLFRKQALYRSGSAPPNWEGGVGFEPTSPALQGRRLSGFVQPPKLFQLLFSEYKPSLVNSKTFPFLTYLLTAAAMALLATFFSFFLSLSESSAAPSGLFASFRHSLIRYGTLPSVGPVSLRKRRRVFLVLASPFLDSQSRNARFSSSSSDSLVAMSSVSALMRTSDMRRILPLWPLAMQARSAALGCMQAAMPFLANMAGNRQAASAVSLWKVSVGAETI